MSLTGSQIGRIHAALVSAYGRDEFRRVVKVCMDVDFDAIAPEKGFSDQVFHLVRWADQQGRSLELVKCAWENNQRNEGLQALWTEVQGWANEAQPSSQSAASPQAPTTGHHVFLAYSRKDSEVMRRLRSDLATAGIVAWIDQENLEPGTPVWQRAIETAIRLTQCVVVILSPDAKVSDWVNIEITFARRIGRRVFPVLARGDEADAVPLLLETTNHVDIRTNYAGIVQGKLIPALRKHLGITDTVDLVQQGDTVLVVTLQPYLAGRLWLDSAQQQVYINRRQLDPPLTPQQFRLLELLATTPNRIISGDEIADTIWPEEYGNVTETMIVNLVAGLRQRLARTDAHYVFIESIRGLGIRFHPP